MTVAHFMKLVPSNSGRMGNISTD